MNQPKYRKFAHVFLYILVALVILVSAQLLGTPRRDTIKELTYSELLDYVEND